MKRMVIKGSEWARGGRTAQRLHNTDGTYCCLGIHGRACGIPDEVLANHYYRTAS